MLTDAELDAVDARVKAATAGPWAWMSYGPSGGGECSPAELGEYDVAWLGVEGSFGEADCVLWCPVSPPREANARFLAASRRDVPALLADVRALHALLADLAGESPAAAKALDLARENARLRAALQGLVDAIVLHEDGGDEWMASVPLDAIGKAEEALGEG